MRIEEVQVGMLVKSNRDYEETENGYMIGKIVKKPEPDDISVLVKFIENHNSRSDVVWKVGNAILWPIDYLDIYEDRRI